VISSFPSVPVKTTVPVSFGNVIVLSAVGSTTVRIVSNPSSVAPSKVIVPSSLTFKVVVFCEVVVIVENVIVPFSNQLHLIVDC